MNEHTAESTRRWAYLGSRRLRFLTFLLESEAAVSEAVVAEAIVGEAVVGEAAVATEAAIEAGIARVDAGVAQAHIVTLIEKAGITKA